MDINILTFEGCPNAEPTYALIERVLAEEGLTADVQMVEINDEEMAQEYHFPGSPSVQVNGRDIETTRANDSDYAITCRIYETLEGRAGIPPIDMIRVALCAVKPEKGRR